MALIDKEPVCACGCVWVCVCSSRSTQLRLYASPLCVCFVWVCVWEKEKTERERESCDSTVFLSWRHFLPSSNLSVYQAKMLSERLLRQLDNTPSTCTHTHLLPSYQHPSSQHPFKQPSPVIYRKAHKHIRKIKHPFLFTYTCSLRCWLSAVLSWGVVAGAHGVLRCEKGGKKGRRHNNILYQQTSTLPSLVIQMPSTRRPNVFTQRLTLLAAKLGLRFGLRSEAAATFCGVGFKSKRKKTWCFIRHTVFG